MADDLNVDEGSGDRTMTWFEGVADVVSTAAGVVAAGVAVNFQPSSDWSKAALAFSCVGGFIYCCAKPCSNHNVKHAANFFVSILFAVSAVLSTVAAAKN